jgi:hypothetical protein
MKRCAEALAEEAVVHFSGDSRLCLADGRWVVSLLSVAERDGDRFSPRSTQRSPRNKVGADILSALYTPPVRAGGEGG